MVSCLRRVAILWSAVAVMAGPGVSASVDLSDEFDMALRAAPVHLKNAAGVFVLGKDGFVEKRASTNGYNCLVEREGGLGTSPMCFDHVGSISTMKAVLMQARLRQSGLREDDVAEAIKAAYAKGELVAPKGPGIVYMLSTDFKGPNRQTGKPECIFPPHVMFYAPYLRNADLGIPRTDFGSTTRPWILNEGRPDAYFIMADHSQHHDC